MKYFKLSVSAFLMAISCHSASAQVPQPWSGTCSIQFSGKSTLHSFEGSVAAEPFVISTAHPTDPAKATAQGRIVAKAAKMNTDNARRDRKMYEVLDTATYPDIVVDLGTLTAAATKPVAGGKVPQPTVIPFDLTIRGKKLTLTGRVSNWMYSDTKIGFQVDFPISLASFGIKPPTVIGIIKVENTIQVAAEVSLVRK